MAEMSSPINCESIDIENFNKVYVSKIFIIINMHSTWTSRNEIRVNENKVTESLSTSQELQLHENEMSHQIQNFSFHGINADSNKNADIHNDNYEVLSKLINYKFQDESNPSIKDEFEIDSQ